MEKYHESVYKMWDDFMELHPGLKEKTFTAWYFCNTEDCANKLAELVLKGIKRGTTSLMYWYDTGKENIPSKGGFSVVTDWNGNAKCIIRTKKVTILPFKDFSQELAAIEGEGDKSLEYWRRAHVKFFTDEMKSENLNFSEDMEIVFEEFELIYPV